MKDGRKSKQNDFYRLFVHMLQWLPRQIISMRGERGKIRGGTALERRAATIFSSEAPRSHFGGMLIPSVYSQYVVFPLRVIRDGREIPPESITLGDR